MEFVKGKVLSDLVHEQGPLPFAQAVDYVAQSARGLEYALRQGVIHRDIKPANLILDLNGRVRVLDMGLARLDTVEENSRDQLTKAGTSDYMAPEQALDSIRADQRSDIYSLGCTLYYLLCAEVLFPSSSETKRLLDHQTAPPPPLKAKRPDAPKQLVAVFQKMVAKKPEQRFQTMVEVLEALDALKGVLGDAPTTTVAAAKPVSKVARPDGDGTGLSKLMTPSMLRTVEDASEEIPIENLREPPGWKKFRFFEEVNG